MFGSNVPFARCTAERAGLCVALALALVAACSAQGNANSAAGGAGPTGAGGQLTTASSGTTAAGPGGSGGGFAACSKFSAEAQQVPAAMLIVLDRTASMSQLGKWGAAQTAIVTAIDKSVFDTMSLGLLAFPSQTSVPGPACIFGFPVYCDVSALPQVPIALAGTSKSSDGSGVRHAIYQYLVDNGPETADSADSSPIYAALNGGYQFIKTVSGIERRIVVLITDGGGSCTSLSNPPRPAYVDANGCSDWEEPPIMAQLITTAQTDSAAPVETFIVGVPGSDSTGQPVGSYDTPPYSMLLALSTYAVAGSPTTLDPSCDKGLVFSQTAPAPAHPCHIDLSNGATFNVDALANAIATIRGNALGCVYDLPPPPQGQTIDPALVNVVLTIDGTSSTIPKRADPSDACATSPCWDYDANGRVQLIGNACTSVSNATTAKVEIYVGCETIVK